MYKIQIDYNAANGVAIDVADDVLPFWWIEIHVYLFRFNQLKLLLHAEIKWFYDTLNLLNVISLALHFEAGDTCLYLGPPLIYVVV